jgi:hypothetical protein
LRGSQIAKNDGNEAVVTGEGVDRIFFIFYQNPPLTIPPGRALRAQTRLRAARGFIKKMAARPIFFLICPFFRQSGDDRLTENCAQPHHFWISKTYEKTYFWRDSVGVQIPMRALIIHTLPFLLWNLDTMQLFQLTTI